MILSEICLNRAALHTSVFFPDAEIKTINKKFDDLTQNDIVCSEEKPTLHILSNVLDMLCFDLEKFSALVKDSLNGYNQFVCVGPYFNYAEKDDRMEVFPNLLNCKKSFSIILKKGELNSDKNWTCQIVSFLMGDLDKNLSTELSEADWYLVNNCIGGISKVIYSKDGDRLLHCQNPDLLNYTVINGTRVICNNAFEDREIKQISIPNSVEIIGDYAFSLCDLQHIIIPSSVKKLGKGAFYACFDLIQITISSSDTSFEKDTFSDCDSLRQIIIPEGSTGKFKKMLDEELWDKLVESTIDTENLSTEVSEEDFANGIEDEFGIIYSKDGKRLLKCNNFKLESYSIKYGTKEICYQAFGSCSLLSQISIPDSVEKIDGQAFLACKSLQQVVIPTSITNIGWEAFSLCNSLQQIYIPNSVTSLGAAAFFKCASLQQISIPDTITRIDYQTFCKCDSLKHIIISNSVTVIGDWAFSECKSLQQISIPNSVTYIGEGAFSKCESLQQVTFPDSLCCIGAFAFEECKSLQRITIPDSVNHIMSGAFSRCTSLQQITIPNSVTVIGDEIFFESAFKDCRALQQIIIPKGSTERFKKMLDNELWDKLVEE